MSKGALELLLTKAKELEKKYEWLLATKLYDEASDVALKRQDFSKAAELQECKGFCFFGAAFQAQTNIEFKELLKKAIQAYQKESEIIGAKEADNQLIISQANASIVYTRSWLETNVSKKKKLLAEWWKLENYLLTAYENIGNIYRVGKICNDMAEYSTYNRFWLDSRYLDHERVYKDCLIFSEKAIKIFIKLKKKHELARAYSNASYYYSFSMDYRKNKSQSKQIIKKCQNYVDKALEISKEIGDAELISKSYQSASWAAQMLEGDPSASEKYAENMVKYGRITKNNYLVGFGNCLAAIATNFLSILFEDPDKQKKSYEKAIELSKRAIEKFRIMTKNPGLWFACYFFARTSIDLATIEPNLKIKQALLKKALKICQKGMQWLKGWKRSELFFADGLSQNLLTISKTQTEKSEVRTILHKAKYYSQKTITLHEEMYPFSYNSKNRNYFISALIQDSLAEIEINNSKKIDLLEQAASSMKKAIEILQKSPRTKSAWVSGFYFGNYNEMHAKILKQIYSMTKDKKKLEKSINAYIMAIDYFKKSDMFSHVAEAYWNIAQNYDALGEYLEASKNFELASKTYDVARRKIPQLKDFFKNYSLYMRAWSQIEQAKLNHSMEEYEKAKQQYEKAAELHESTESWSYLASNYFAWANMEEAEDQSRRENTQEAKEAFQKALEQFGKAEESFKQKIGEITSPEEKELTLRLLKASDHRRKFCQARIQIEEAKLLDRRGKYLQSSKSYREAAQNILAIFEKVESEAERKELEYLAILCQAWEKMTLAEGKSSPEVFLGAAELFEEARQLSITEKTSLWALANSSFCKGLAAKNQFQSTFEKSYHSMAKKHVEQASNYYRRAGFETASEYAKATQRLLDAYVYVNSAQEEVDPEKRTKFYQLAEQLLQIAAGLFVKAKQPEKTAQVQQIIKTTREERVLAASLNKVLHAPTITSSTMTFTAPSPTDEVSVGLEQFQHANVQANLIADMKEVRVGESFCLSVEFVNAGKEPALLTRVEDFIPHDFIVVKKPEIYRLEESCLNMKGKQIAPLKLVEAKIVLQPSKKGVYQLKPTVHYLDELGQNKSLQLKSVEIKVEEVVLANRVSTGTKELDSLLLGGIPKEYAVVLTGSPSDERELLIKSFLEAGIKEAQTSFYVTTEAVGIENLLEKPGFYPFLCNPKPKSPVPDLSNVTWLKSKTDLNNLNMALVRASRSVQQKQGVKRIVIGNVSDVLLKDGPEVTRRWLSELISDLTSKGFTLFAVVNPEMHTSEQTGAVLDLFDGEINIAQTGVPPDCKKSLMIKRLRGQDYIKNPICLMM